MGSGILGVVVLAVLVVGARVAGRRRERTRDGAEELTAWAVVDSWRRGSGHVTVRVADEGVTLRVLLRREVRLAPGPFRRCGPWVRLAEAHIRPRSAERLVQALLAHGWVEEPTGERLRRAGDPPPPDATRTAVWAGGALMLGPVILGLLTLPQMLTSPVALVPSCGVLAGAVFGVLSVALRVASTGDAVWFDTPFRRIGPVDRRDLDVRRSGQVVVCACRERRLPIVLGALTKSRARELCDALDLPPTAPATSF